MNLFSRSLVMAAAVGLLVSGCSKEDDSAAPAASVSGGAEASAGEEGTAAQEEEEGEYNYLDGQPFEDTVSGGELVATLRQGGLVIYIRHGATESDYADQVDAVIGDCSTQRTLSAQGWQQAQGIGTSFERLRIPVGQVISSEYCRAWQTAEIAFGPGEKKKAELNFPASDDYTEQDIAAMKADVTPLISAVPPAGKNTVIVAHDDPFEAATGLYPDPQGIAYIIRPEGNGSFELIANLEAQEWLELKN